MAWLHDLTLFIVKAAAPLLFVILLGVIYKWIKLRNRQKRERFIRQFKFPPGLIARLTKKHPQLTAKESQLVVTALRHFFLAYHFTAYRHVAMPSEVVDDLWHEFILYTREYQSFCKLAFGQFFHHMPAAVLGQNRQNNDGLRRTWVQVCKLEFISANKPSRLPLLFAIDAKLNIKDGRRYALNCGKDNVLSGGTSYCVGDFAGSSDSSGLFSSESGNSGDNGGCGGGDSGCGGGDSGCGGGGGCGGGD